MKHFLVEIQYLVPVEQMADILPDHRAFLQTGYDKGIASSVRTKRTPDWWFGNCRCRITGRYSKPFLPMIHITLKKVAIP